MARFEMSLHGRTLGIVEGDTRDEAVMLAGAHHGPEVKVSGDPVERTALFHMQGAEVLGITVLDIDNNPIDGLTGLSVVEWQELAIEWPLAIRLEAH